MRSRSEVVKLVSSWIGKKEADGSYKEIIDIYNSFTGAFPRGIRMKYGWSWCACTWSALAIALGYTDIMPIEISCGELIKRAKEMGCWQENDGYVPSPATRSFMTGMIIELGIILVGRIMSAQWITAIPMLAI